MREFCPKLPARLDALIDGDEINYVGLGGWMLSVSIGNTVRIGCEKEVAFKINGRDYRWIVGTPSDNPFQLLIGEVPASFALISPLALRLNFESGGFLEFHSSLEPYEAVVIHLTPEDGENETLVF